MFKMSDIQAIIELIEKGRKSNEYGDGWGQISTAVAMLKNMQEDSHLHSGQRWELSQILGCGPLYGDIEKAVKELKEAQTERWLPIDSAPKDGSAIISLVHGKVVIVKYTGIIDWFDETTCGASRYAWIEEGAEDADNELLPTHWMSEPALPLCLAETK
jgi:hypothetical protein